MNFLFNIPSFASVLKNTAFITSVSEKIQRATSHYTPSLAMTLLPVELLQLHQFARAAYPYHCNLQEGPTPSCHKCTTTTYIPRNLILFGLHCDNFVLSLHPQKGRQASVRLKQLIVLLGLGTCAFWYCLKSVGSSTLILSFVEVHLLHRGKEVTHKN